MINQKTPVENYQKVIKDAELLYTDTEINKTIDDIGKAITRELKTSNPIIMPIMIGGLILAGQLIPKLNSFIKPISSLIFAASSKFRSLAASNISISSFSISLLI